MTKLTVGPRLALWIAAEAAIFLAKKKRREVVVEFTGNSLPSPLMVARPEDTCADRVASKHREWCRNNEFDPNYICRIPSNPPPSIRSSYPSLQRHVA